MYINDSYNTPTNVASHEVRNIKGSKYSSLFVMENTDSNGDMVSPFGEETPKPCWYGTDIIVIKPTPEGTGASYKFPHGQNKTNGHDLLLRSMFLIDLPQITIKDTCMGRYRIAWTRDVGIHIPVSGVLDIGSVEFSHITSYYNKARSRFYVTKDERDAFENDIGNRPELIEWSVHMLPAAKIRSPQPWFYSRHYPDTAFTLFRLGMQNELTHKFDFNLSILALLRIEEEIDGFWSPVTVDCTNIEFYKKILNGPSDGNFMLRFPTMVCEVVSIRPSQKTAIYLEKTVGVGYDPDVFYYRDVITGRIAEACKFGSQYDIKITYETDCLIRNFYIVVQNEAAIKAKDYSNFTTSTDETKGEGPLSTIAYKIGDVPKIPPIDADTLISMASGKFPTSTREHGIYPYSVSCKSNSDGVDIGSPATITHTWTLKFKEAPSQSVAGTRFIVSCQVELFKQARFSNGGVLF